MRKRKGMDWVVGVNFRELGGGETVIIIYNSKMSIFNKN